MSVKVPHKHAEVIKAWADGAKLQWKCNDKWIDFGDDLTPSFLPSSEYRIKPEPKPDVVIEERLFLNGCKGITHEPCSPSWRGARCPVVRYVFDSENHYELKSVEIVK